MKFKKFAAVAAAIAVLASGAPVMGLSNPLSVTASAAEAKLVTGTLDAETFEKLCGENRVYLGNGYFALTTPKQFEDEFGRVTTYNAVDKIVRIGDKEIANWRSTGKLEPTTIESDIDLSKCSYRIGAFEYGDYVLFNNSSENISYMCKLDKASGKITKVYDITDVDSMWDSAISNVDGYCIHLKGSSRAGADLGAMYAPTGEKLDTSSIDFRTAGLHTISGMEKYVAYTGSMDYSAKIYGICQNGSIEEVYSTSDGYCSVKNAGYGFVQLIAVTYGNEGVINSNIILTNDGKEYKLGDVGTINSVFGTVAVMSITEFDEYTWQETTKGYKLIDINDNGKELSKTYTYMGTRDNGKTYLVQTEDGKQWGFIDNTGKELAMFDDADVFVENGLYAPVVQDGKGWLVDKNMNQVSEKIDATLCRTIGAELFRFETPNGNVLVTSTGKGTDGSVVKPGNSGTSNNGTALTDKNSGVSVNGNFPSDTKLNVTKTKKDDNTYIVDVTPVDANGNKVQPNGAAVVMAVIPELKGKTVNVYRVTDGNYTKLNSWVDGDGIFFTTTHFSEFEITTETRTEANPNTGSPAVMLGVIALAGAFAVVSRKKR